MKQITIFLINLAGFVLQASAQTAPLYFNILTHNEETAQWGLPNFYAANRARLVSFTNYLTTSGATWNMQSDWTYLTAVIQLDTQYFPITNNKNILRWMHEDMGVEMDPHGHESSHIYPDLVYLMDSIGLPESKVIGGSIYNDDNGINNWVNLINGQNGVVYPQRFWKPEYLMGGGTPNHVDDLRYHGFWNPQDNDNYLTHDASSPLHHIGVGCSIKVQDTSTVAWTVAQLKQVVDNVHSGAYDPSNPFYLQTVFFEQAELNNLGFYNMMLAIVDSMNAIVAEGQAEWKSFSQGYTQWENEGMPMYQWECGQQLETNVIEAENDADFTLFPNPTAGSVMVQLPIAELPATFDILDLAGRKVYQQPITETNERIDLSRIVAGLYLFRSVGSSGTKWSGQFVVVH